VTASEKTCVSCGRVITWRKKWARDWDQIRYCSDACRRRGRTAQDEFLEAAIRTALARGGAVTDTGIPRPAGVELEQVRRAARRLVAAGEVEVVQRGRVVDPSTAKGPFEIRRRPGR
jgi:hypothetical protein